MHGDLSRAAFDPTRYSRVVAQQGRTQLDSDWNEQQAIVDYRLRTLVADVFGAAAHGAAGSAIVPAANAGFGLHVHAGGAFDGATSHDDWLASEWSGGTDPFTVAVWIAPAAAPKADGSLGTIVACRGAYSVAVGSGGRVVFERSETRGSGPEPKTAPQTLSSRTPLRADGFSFVACVFTGDAMEIWIDGALAGRCAAGPAPWINAPLRIGAGFGPDDAPQDGYAGTIEHAFIRRRRVLPNEIAAAFAHPPAEHAREHGSHWTFERGAGQAVQAAAPRLCAGPGRAYVDGRMCANAYHLDVPAPVHGESVAYLDVWERYVSAFEDAALREPALDGADTTGRVRTVARVRLIAGTDLAPLARAAGDPAQIAVGMGRDFAKDNLLYRFEIHAPANALGSGDEAAEVMLDDPATARPDGLRALTVTNAVDWKPGQYLVPESPGTPPLRVVSQDDAGGRAFTVACATPQTPRPLKVRPAAALLWSSENGHVVFACKDEPRTSDAAAQSTAIAIEDEAGRAERLTIGDIVVLTDEARIDAGTPGFLTTIVSTSTEQTGLVDVVVAGRAPALGPGATLRRWDGVLAAIPSDVPAEAGDLRVRFGTGGTFRTGDFWLATVRPTSAVQLDWPDDGKAFRAPDGTQHAYAALAAIQTGANGPHVARDLRHVVHSVTDLAARTHDVAQRTDELARSVGEEIERAVDGAVARALERMAERERAWEREHERREREWHERERERREHHERERHEHEHHEPEHHEHGMHERGDGLVLARTAPHGYVPTGSVVDAPVEQPVWRALAHVPDSGPADAVTIGGFVYVLFATGTLLRLDPHDPVEPWTALAPNVRPRREYAVTAAHGRLYVAGGIYADGAPSALVDAYDPRTNTWAEGWSTMRIARAQPIVAASGDTVVVCGGICRNGLGSRYVTHTAEMYDADAERWRMLAPMPFRRYGAAAACAGGSLYVAGGALATSLVARVRRTARVDRMHLRTGTWTEHTPLEAARFGARAVAVGDEIVVFGGDAGAPGERVSTRTDDVRRLAWPGRDKAGVAAAGGVVYAIAGMRDGEQRSDAHACTLIDHMHVYRRRPDHEEM